MFRFLAIIGAIVTAVFPEMLLAQGAVEDGILSVSGTLDDTIGQDGFGELFLVVIEDFAPIMYSAAILIITAYGLVMVISQDENQFTEARKVVITVCVALILLSLAPAIRDIYSTWNSGGSFIFIAEVRGLIRFLETPIAVIAVLMIIISGIRAIIAFGSDEGLQRLRSTIIAIFFGILLIIFKYVIVGDVTERLRPDGIVASIRAVLQVITVFMGLMAVVGIVYAGLLMIVNVGNDEQYGRARGLLVRIIIGIIVILVAEAIVSAIFELDVFGLI